MSSKNLHEKPQNAQIYNIEQKNQKNKKKYQNNAKQDTSVHRYIIPIFILFCIIPFIIRMKTYDPNMSQFSWFADIDSYDDYFLYYKQWLLVVVAGIMVVIIAFKSYKDKNIIRFTPVFVPLGIYALMVMLSAVFSKYPSFAFFGGFEQFEGVFALLGYCIIVYYCFLFFNTEQDFKFIMKYLIIAAVIMSFLGILQLVGHDFFATELGNKLILPLKDQTGYELKFNFGEHRVYLTLYNPNYVGVYVSLVAPIIMIMLFFERNVRNIMILVVALIGLLISMIGAQSLAGILGLGIAAIFIVILLWRYLVKRYYITIPIVLLIIIGLLVLNNVTDRRLLNKLANAFENSKSKYALTQMDTNDDNVSITYNGNKMYVIYQINDNETINLLAIDENNQIIASTYDEVTYSFTLTDERFIGIIIGINTNTSGEFYIQESGVQWLFTNQTGDGTYYYINRMNKLDKMVTAPSAVFTNYEQFASSRGYIWSRTIPILKNYILLGSGPDTFAMAYPQQDYMNIKRLGYGNAIITKPHNLYLQIATQTGLISLIGFLVFYGIYFVSSVRLYINGRFTSYYAQVGVAVFVGTVAYMFAGLANDSSITTAPIFWTLIGVGIAVNHKAKPLIKEEVAVMNEKMIDEKNRKQKKNKLFNG
ncbi:MAG: hypothetical protein K0S01_3699 [Herbinix sp.]|jgi:O-antigen ligase|nr:hypothetical protein [Herbinix sp.]